MKRALILFSLLLFPSAGQAEELNIGYVDLERAIQEVEEGKRAKSRLEQEAAKKQAELSKQEEELQKLKAALDAQASVATQSPEMRAKMTEFQQKALQLQERLNTEQRQLMALEQQEMQSILKKMREVIAIVGKAGGYSLVLESNKTKLLYAEAQHDLTNEVIRKYNQKYK